MATQSICKIDDCDKPVYGHAMCKSHWRKWRKEQGPAGTQPARGELQEYLEQVVLTCISEECLIWPYSGNGRGYGKITYGDKRQYVHRLVCEIVNGPAPSPRHQAAHGCGKGHLGCVNPRHISWLTPEENQADKLRHGTHQLGEQNAMSKLTPDDIKKIRALRGEKTQAEIGRMFGIHQVQVSRIHRKARWSWLE